MNTRITGVLAMGLVLGAMSAPGLAASDAAVTGEAERPTGSMAALLAFQETDEEAAYRAAREAVTRERFQRASALFSELRDRFPETRYAPESLYWQAFSLYRLDGQRELREALRLLELQLDQYPSARVSEEARDLSLRIRATLGRRGDAGAAERALRQAELALSVTPELASLEGELGRAEQAIARGAMAAEMAAQRAEMASRAVSGRGAGISRARGQASQECEDSDVRQAAVQALMQMDTDRAIPILRRVLERRDECSAPLRKQAVFVLSQHRPNEVEDLMLEVARQDPDPEVQEAAVFWLSQVDSPRAVAALSDILRTTDDPNLQEKAIFALSQHGGPEAADLLRSYALDSTKPERVRENAIFWFSQNPDYADASFLIDLYGELESADLKEHVFFSVSQLDDPAAIDWILERALDQGESLELRKQALFWAGQHRSVDLARLSGLYGRLSDREMKEQLIFLYSQRSESEAVTQLIQIARDETDPELRKKAVFWLGQSGDERAIEFLLDLVDPPR